MKDVDEDTRAELMKVSLHQEINIKKKLFIEGFSKLFKIYPGNQKEHR